MEDHGDLRKKILYTLMMLLIFRLLCFIPTPGVDTSNIQSFLNQLLAASDSCSR